MKVLVVGGGGREHAMVEAISRSKHVDKIYCAPGNAGIAKLAECVPFGVMEFDKIGEFAKKHQVTVDTVRHYINEGLLTPLRENTVFFR